MHKKTPHIWSLVVVVLAVAVAAAAMTATEAIQARQKAMEGVREGMGALAAIAKQEQPFDAEVVAANAEKIAGHLAEAAELFPEGSDSGDVETWSKAEIWTDREDFDKLLTSTQQAAVEMQSVSEMAAFRPALGKLGNGCKSCHDLYRLPKN